MDAVLVRSTYGSMEAAREAGRQLVEAGVAACVHVAPIASCYMWQGGLEQASEARLEARCRPEKAQQAADLLRAGHPYDVPLLEFVASRVDGAYGAWMDEVTARG